MVSWMMTIKAMLISSGVASMGLLLKVSVPVAIDFSVSTAPIVWNYLLSWLKPPYLYVVTNGIIIIIVISSKYYRSTGEDDEGDYHIQTEPIVHQAMEVKNLDLDSQFGFVMVTPTSPKLESDVVKEVVFDDGEERVTDAVARVEDEYEIEEELKSVIMVENSDQIESGSLQPNSNQNHLSPTMTKLEKFALTEKPLVSTKFGHRKSAKSNTEGTNISAFFKC